MMKTILTVVFVGLACQAFALDQVEQENRYMDFMAKLQRGDAKSLLVFDREDGKLLVDALWDAQEDGRLPLNQREELFGIDESQLTVKDQLRLAVLRHRVGLPFQRRSLITQVITTLPEREAGNELALVIVALRQDLREMGLGFLVTTAKLMQPISTRVSLKIEEGGVGDQTQLAHDLWNNPLDLSSWRKGEYANAIRIYMFCRSVRVYPCIQVIRKANNEPVRTEDGKLWWQPSLASSKRGLPSNQSNGNTPAGIHTIDGVMPVADDPMGFGKFRRLILDFIPKSKNEQSQRYLLPESSQASDWWRANVVARDMGRSLFRIHGTGKINPDPTSTFYPFMQTSGCVAKRENTYDGVEYKDQRLLLDTLMAAMNLPVAYENELKIKGLLFVFELNDEAAPVTLEDLDAIGIN